MKEVARNLFVGDAADYASVCDNPEWFIISAAKEPWHRYAVGYSGRAAAKDDPEYLMAKRDNHLILNLVDANDPAYVSDQIIDAALDAIDEHIGTQKVLVHCNQGGSRSPTIAMLWLAERGELRGVEPDSIPDKFTALYPAYLPAKGMWLYARHRLAQRGIIS